MPAHFCLSGTEWLGQWGSNSAWPANSHWHTADQVLIKLQFSLSDFYWCKVNKNKLRHFTIGLQELQLQHQSVVYLLKLLLYNFLSWWLSSKCPWFTSFSFQLLFYVTVVYPLCHPPLSGCFSSPLSPIQLLPPSSFSLPAACLDCRSWGE